MARLRVVLALAAAMLLTAACGSGAATRTASIGFSGSDIRFLQDMIGHHQQAIDMAVLVEGRSHRRELVGFAAGIATTRQAEISTMRRWLTQWNQPQPPATTAADAESSPPGMLGGGQLDWLKLLKGSRFDLGFVTMMDTHHGGAVTMAETELRAGASLEVKELAGRILATQNAELGRLHDWKEAWSSGAGHASGG
ncbi:MAG TPA: DUF305 domain-containing protein [Actinomycetes bacterium]|nr:DUF305 domain-containing protein [Actinomycetes bacterium]